MKKTRFCSTAAVALLSNETSDETPGANSPTSQFRAWAEPPLAPFLPPLPPLAWIPFAEVGPSRTRPISPTNALAFTHDPAWLRVAS